MGSLSIGGGFSGNGNGKSESFRAEERWLYEMTDLMGKVDSGQDKGEAEAIL